MRRMRLMTTCCLALALAVPQLAAADEYRLGSQDKLTILGSVPSLGFPFFVHMLNQIKAEAQAQ
ncbi:MAG: hypothetical protein E5Y60_30790, partial [Mesorhizobium sp.]